MSKKLVQHYFIQSRLKDATHYNFIFPNYTLCKLFPYSAWILANERIQAASKTNKNREWEVTRNLFYFYLAY